MGVNRLAIRRVGNASVLTVPRSILEIVPEGQEFIAELTDDGILYRAVDPEPQPIPAILPAWARRS